VARVINLSIPKDLNPGEIPVKLRNGPTATLRQGHDVTIRFDEVQIPQASMTLSPRARNEAKKIEPA